MSTTTARRPTGPTVLKPSSDLRLRLINSLLLTTLVGTAWSVISTSSATTAFRSRLPAKTLTRLVNSQTAFPVPSLPFFADKRNTLNQLFVKKSWGWVTALFLVLSLTLFLFHPHHPSTSRRPSPTSSTATSSSRPSLAPTTTHLLSSLRRFLLASLFWFYLTQATWFGRNLGPSVAFRILKGSGGVCVPSAVSSSSSTVPPAVVGDSAAAQGLVCTGARGEYWRGGHDVSGHAFMMVHASLFLFELVYPLLPSLFPSIFKPYNPQASTGPHRDDDVSVSAIVKEAEAKRREEERVGAPGGVAGGRGPLHPAVALVGYAATGVMVLCWWMLLMTSLFFHSPAEKLTGVAFGLAGWYVSGL